MGVGWIRRNLRRLKARLDAVLAEGIGNDDMSVSCFEVPTDKSRVKLPLWDWWCSEQQDQNRSTVGGFGGPWGWGQGVRCRVGVRVTAKGIGDGQGFRRGRVRVPVVPCRLVPWFPHPTL